MEETSIGIAASAAVSPLAEWVDLDGCLLLADDPFDGPRDRAGQALAPGRPARPRTPAAGRLAALNRAPLAGLEQRRIHRFAWAAEPVHACRWRVDKLVHNVVEKPLTVTSRRPYDVVTVRARDSEAGARAAITIGIAADGRDHPARPPADCPRARGLRRTRIDAARRPSDPVHARGRGLRPVLLPATPRRAGRSCTTRCARWRHAGCSGAWAPTRWRRSASASACSRRRAWRRWSRGLPPRSRRPGGRLVSAATGAGASRGDALVAVGTAAAEALTRRRLRRDRSRSGSERWTPEPQARMRRRAISPSIWRSASTYRSICSRSWLASGV